MNSLTPTLRRAGLAFTALGVAFLGALLVMGGNTAGFLLIALGLPLSGVFALAGDALGGGFGATLRERWAGLLAQTRPWMWFVALYAALKIPVPLWPEGFPVPGLASTGALFVAALLYARDRVGLGRAAGLAVVAFAVGLGVEVLGHRTGFPFGIYSYDTAPPPRLLGVPLLVPLGWFALTLAAARLAGGRPWLAGVLLTLWDVGLEPLMTAQRYWLWDDPRPLWAGAPLQNFLGWWAVGTFIAWLFTRMAPELFSRAEPGWRLPMQEHRAEVKVHVGPPSIQPAPRPDVTRLDLGVAYPLEAFFLPGGLVLVGRYLEAAVTLAAMVLGLGLARAVRREREAS